MDFEPQIIEVEGQKYRSVTLDEWMMQLASDHPARGELNALRFKLAQALQTIDQLEAENSALQMRLVQYQMASYEKTQNRAQPDPAGMAAAPPAPAADQAGGIGPGDR